MGTCLLSAVVVHERSANVLVDCVIGGSEMVSVDLDISRVWGDMSSMLEFWGSRSAVVHVYVFRVCRVARHVVLLAGIHQICVDMEACSNHQTVSSVLVLCIGFSVPPCVAHMSSQQPPSPTGSWQGVSPSGHHGLVCQDQFLRCVLCA